MKYIVLFLAAAAVLFMAGCSTTERIAEGIATKNVTGNGTFIKTNVGIDPDSKIPGIYTTFVSGDYASAKSGTNSILYRSESTGSIWNAKSLTKKQFVSITLVDDGNVGDVIRAVSDVLRAASEANKKDDTESEPKTD